MLQSIHDEGPEALSIAVLCLLNLKRGAEVPSVGLASPMPSKLMILSLQGPLHTFLTACSLCLSLLSLVQHVPPNLSTSAVALELSIDQPSPQPPPMACLGA